MLNTKFYATPPIAGPCVHIPSARLRITSRREDARRILSTDGGRATVSYSRCPGTKLFRMAGGTGPGLAALQRTSCEHCGNSHLLGSDRASAGEIRLCLGGQDPRWCTQEQFAAGTPLVRNLEERRNGLRTAMGKGRHSPLSPYARSSRRSSPRALANRRIHPERRRERFRRPDAAHQGDRFRAVYGDHDAGGKRAGIPGKRPGLLARVKPSLRRPGPASVDPGVEEETWNVAGGIWSGRSQ